MNTNAAENKRCWCCGWEYDEDGNCDCHPEGYIKPGSTALLYVNAYSVTRHFGGREEGGWWYNRYEPIASIPVRAISKEGHDDTCYQCDCARKGRTQEDGTPCKLCKWGFHLVPEKPEQVEEFKKHLSGIYEDVNEGSIYSVLGGSELQILVQNHPGEVYPKQRPHYE
jgi:nicotinamidase-related amidase